MSLESGGFNPNKRKTPDADVVAHVLEGMRKEAERRGLNAANDNEIIANDNEEGSEFGSAELGDVIHKIEQDREAA